MNLEVHVILSTALGFALLDAKSPTHQYIITICSGRPQRRRLGPVGVFQKWIWGKQSKYHKTVDVTFPDSLSILNNHFPSDPGFADLYIMCFTGMKQPHAHSNANEGNHFLKTYSRRDDASIS